MLTLIYYGHSCFLLDDGQYKVLFDPFLTGNPKAAIAAADVDCDYILVSHAHSDHLGDAPEIAARTGAAIVAIPEVLALCEKSKPGLKQYPMNLGGSLTLPFGKVRMTLAQHSAGVADGVACGYVVYLGGKVVYFAGVKSMF
ncbi:MBL fold metallo-hydrolase, partial [Mitsuokella jalaludinii]|uniref:MBL fold metallo-hydrolase n=1 Tax=Mitsuokella jalaludinii TaxID=187979 RepID=UPI00307FBDE6